MFSKLSINCANVKAIGLDNIAKIIQNEGQLAGYKCVSNWLNIEQDPEIIAAQEIDYNDEVSSEFDIAATSESSDEMANTPEPDLENIVIDEPEPESANLIILREKLVKYTDAAMSAPFRDPFLLNLISQLNSHLKENK